MLGLGRNRLQHLLSIFCVNVVFSVIQLLCFFAALIAVGWIDKTYGGGAILNHFTEMYISTDSSLASPLFQMGGAAKLVLMAQYGEVLGSIGFSMFFFASSLICAMISGCGFGFLFSALIKEPSISLNVSVGFVDNAYLPRVEWVAHEKRMPEKVYPSSRVRHLVKLSEYLPQRYFFNIGRLTFNRDRVENETGLIADAICEGMTNRPQWLLTGLAHVYMKPPSLASRSDLVKWIKKDAHGLPDDDKKQQEFLIGYIRKHPDVTQEWRTDIWHRLLIRAISEEMIPLLVIFIVCMVISCSAVYLMGIYYDLR